MQSLRLANILTVLAVLAIVFPGAAPAAEEGSTVEGSGYSLFDTPSIRGFDEQKVAKDPVCDRSKRPKITKVEPDEGKPGDKLVVKGENFGTKECFQGVTFSAEPRAKVDFTFVSDTTVEVKIPEAKSGMTFITMVTGGGSTQSKPVLIKK